ncbi:brachyurin-like [Neocloeon triangulifer]|uniref:brachyurin-like n=1 Tax=Neocloeon triangulifer TaxID=2078957 RepID=UPI00286F0710|nr:brachyurin-like [Neocloeon triangulifer]
MKSRALVFFLTAQILNTAAWLGPFSTAKKARSLAIRAKNKPLTSYSKNEWDALGDSLEPKLDGPIINLINDTRPPNSTKPPEKSEKIINGRRAIRGQNPYQVGIMMDQESFCGGALISADYVITAAHCMERNSYILIFGAQNRSAFEAGRLTIETNKFLLHPKWDSKLIVNDLALFPLPFSVPFSNFIKPIRLPRRSLAFANLDNTNVTVCGWGLTNDGGTASSILSCAQHKLIVNTECAKLYGVQSFKSSNLCAQGYKDQSTCQGDSGGPVAMTEKDNLPTLIGVVSYGASASCENGFPDVFTRVSSYLSWISNVTGIAIRR